MCALQRRCGATGGSSSRLFGLHQESPGGPAERGENQSVARSSCSAGKHYSLASYLVEITPKNTHFKFSITIGIFSLSPFFFFFCTVKVFVPHKDLMFSHVTQCNKMSVQFPAVAGTWALHTERQSRGTGQAAPCVRECWLLCQVVA